MAQKKILWLPAKSGATPPWEGMTESTWARALAAKADWIVTDADEGLPALSWAAKAIRRRTRIAWVPRRGASVGMLARQFPWDLVLAGDERERARLLEELPAQATIDLIDPARGAGNLRRGESPRIAFLCGNFKPEICGVGDYTAQLARELAADHRVLVLARGDRHEASSFPGRDGSLVRVIRPHRTLRRVTWPLWLAELLRFRPDVIHTEWEVHAFRLTGLIPFLMKSAGLRARRVATVHEFYLDDPKLRSHELAALARQELAIVHDDETDRKLAHAFPRLKRIRGFVPSGVPVTGKRASAPWRPGETRFVTFGFLKPGRAIEAAIDFVSRIARAGERPSLTIIGPFDPRGDEYHASLESRARASGADIRFTGQKSEAEVSQLLLDADAALSLIAQTGRSSSLSALLEHGLPVIAVSYAGAAPEGELHLCGSAEPERVLEAYRRIDLARSRGPLPSAWPRLARLHAEVYRGLR